MTGEREDSVISGWHALGLATPMSIMMGTGRGALAGVLIRNAEALEALETVDTLVVDKTGTLTEGRPRLRQLVAVGDAHERDILMLAANVEVGSEHPLAAAIMEDAAAWGIKPLAVENVQSITGKGVVARSGPSTVGLGNIALMSELGIDASAVRERADEVRGEGGTVMFLARDGQLIGLIAVADAIKDSAPEALAQLLQAGLTIVMTGDSRRTAEAVAARLQITQIEAEVLPERKGDLRGIVRARQLSRATMRNIRQNLVFAFGYNALGVPIAAGLLYPWTGLLLSPIIASAAMTFSSVSVIANALRLRRSPL